MVGFPFSFGVWGVDGVSFVEAEAGIVPFEGRRMVRFEATTLGTLSVGTVGDIWNLADVAAWAPLIDAQHARVQVEARCNRVGGDACTDTRFGLQLQAHAGSPLDYPDEWPDPLLVSGFSDLFTDGDPGTWEPLAVEFCPPPATDFVAVVFSTVEDVCPTDLPPFEGHYGDAVTLEVSTWIDLGLGSAGAPRLRGHGTLASGSAGRIALTEAPATTPFLLAIAFGATQPVPLLGGTLTALPADVLLALATDELGAAELDYAVAGGLPSGALVTCQAVVLDAAGVTGVALSNAIEGLALD